jgi:hypothetical protein
MRKVLVRAGIPVLALIVGCVGASRAPAAPWDDPIVSPELPLTAQALGPQVQPSIAFDGTNYLAAWSEYRPPTQQIFGGRLSASGEPLDGDGFVVASGPENLLYAPVVARGGDNYLVSWTGCYHYMEIDHCSLYAARVSREGGVLDPNGILLQSPIDPSTGKAVAFDGANYLVVWDAGTKISATRVSQDGVVLDPQAIPIWAQDFVRPPAVAFDGTNYLVAWEDYAAGDADVIAVRVRPDGTILDPYGIPVAPTVGNQEVPQIAFDGTDYLVAWQGGLSGDRGVCARRVTEWGDVLDPAGIPIATSGNETSPVVTFATPYYVVVWQGLRNGGSHLFGARVAPDGAVLDPAGFVVSDVGSYEAVSGITAPWIGRATVAYGRYDGTSRAFLRFIDEAQPPPPPPPSSAGCLPQEPHPPPPPPPPPPGLLPPPPWPPAPSAKCHVPKVVGLSSRAAGRRIRGRHCRVGRVRRVHTRRAWRGRVVAQGRRAGRVLERGAKINLTLGRR